MVPHARPHIEVHSRSKQHSAIAGVAYRLGLRLYDRRTGVWHDYRKRQVGEEIIRALTLAPPGAPAWASDPHELWSRAEAAERRKDAAVARDYRIPIPFGLSDTAAGDMAEAMARYIVDRLSVPVSIGVHRDSAVDAIGEAKPEEKIGAHAHLYFPTRSLEQMEGEDGTSEWCFGRKLALLASKREGSDFVDQLNAHWALLANQFTQEAGLVSDYDHRSYKRMGIEAIPQPKLGASVVAMERKGFFTGKGDALRGDIVLPSLLYEATHAVVLAEQQARAQADVIRETGSQQEVSSLGLLPAPAPVVQTMLKPTSSDDRSDTPEAVSVCSDMAAADPVVPVSVPPVPPLSEGEPGSLLMRFRAAVPAPETPEAHQVLSQVMKLVQVIARALNALIELADRFRHHHEDRGRRMAAKLDTDIQLDHARVMRVATKQRLADWEQTHPLLMFLTKKATSEEGKPAEWRTLHRAVETQERRVQEIKGALRRHRMHLDAFYQEATVLQDQKREQTEQLRQTLGHVHTLAPSLMDTLVSVAHTDERTWMEEVKPTHGPSPLTQAVEDPPAQVSLVARPRLVPRV
jgi:hypothetical protein